MTFLSVLLGACAPVDDDAADDDAAGLTEGEGDAAGDGGGACVPGQTVACACADGTMGAQTCDDDGTQFGACACAGGDGSGGPGDDGPDDGPDDSPDDGVDDGPGDGMDDDSGGVQIPTYEEVVFIMQQSCGSSLSECHAREAFGADVDEDCRGWAAFEDAAIGSQFYGGPNEGMPTGCPDMDLMTRLLDVNSWQCGEGNPGPGLPLVVPGDPAASYLMMKIDGDVCMLQDGPSLVMPPADSKIVLSDEDRGVLEAWILAGAPGA